MRSRLLSCAVLAAHVVFLLVIAFGAPCTERCPDDLPDGGCAPACVTCACSPRPASTAPVAAVTPPVPAVSAVAAVELVAPAQPDPDDIAHVPKPLRA